MSACMLGCVRMDCFEGLMTLYNILRGYISTVMTLHGLEFLKIWGSS